MSACHVQLETRTQPLILLAGFFFGQLEYYVFVKKLKGQQQNIGFSTHVGRSKIASLVSNYNIGVLYI